MLVAKQLCVGDKGVFSFRSKAMYGSFIGFAVVTVGGLDSLIVKMFALLILLCPHKLVFVL